MLVRLLGPIEVAVAGEVRPVPGLRRKAVLAALTLEPGTVISTDRLINIVWADAAPANAVNALQRHVSYLRGLLGDRTTVRGQPPGYVLALDADGTDVRRAERLVQEGTRADEPAQRVAVLQAAVGLWRGSALFDVACLPWFETHARRLEELLARARYALAESRLELGQLDQAILELESLRREYPLDERIHKLLMLALYGASRQADALAVYGSLRNTLSDELGISPSQPLRALETAILRQDPGLDEPATAPARPSAPATPVRPPVVPAQLPPALASFSGRRDELRRLDSLLRLDGQPPADMPTSVIITALAGTAGVGKTALAVYWAHRVAPHFPDGQLYVNLRGFTLGVTPVDPAEAVHLFLTALGVPVQQIPVSLDARTNLYRSLLSGRKVLVVLDNARNAEHARPLLPGAPGCLALVTSRDQLTPLVATEGAVPVEVGLLPAADAHALVAVRVGAERMAAEPAMAAEIVARCEGLPLALSLAAARAATNPRMPLATLANELQVGTRALDVLDGGDPGTDLRAVFEWSYRTLSPEAARLYRLLGLRTGPGFTTPAAASMVGLPSERVMPLLAELTRASLITSFPSGRYGTHDLLCVFAYEKAITIDSEGERNAAVHRLLQHFLHTAYAATRLLEPDQPLAPPATPPPGVRPERLIEAGGAASWFVAEHGQLVPAVLTAADMGWHGAACQLAAVMEVYLDRHGHWHDLATVSATARRSAQQLGDPTAESYARRGLALAAARLGQPSDEYTTA